MHINDFRNLLTISLQIFFNAIRFILFFIYKYIFQNPQAIISPNNKGLFRIALSQVSLQFHLVVTI